ncbi:putative DNA ligase [Trypanosoma conorhini]|uniref:Putative DNA ligase n=1 Tax=Trypanosoma conorhini TaxID=83891 RepID=A0A3R7P615_9TRYP|nr:putative DNA ligase [Trypanosoma conorhini]RNF18012.1 putative DNA ligase [Trypanosoma conorhini]
MWRRWSCVLRAAPAPLDPSLLFGVGRPRTKEQAMKYQEMKNTSIQAAFPHLAACWVGPCWGTVMITPNHLSPVCTKIAVWRCSECLQEFEMSVAKFIDQHGVCPLCKKPQRKPEAADAEPEAKGSPTAETKSGDAGSESAAATSASPNNGVAYAKAPRMIHTNYKSVLHDNPEWEEINIQPMLAQKWESVAAQLLNPGPGEEKELLLASPKIDGIRCLIGYNQRRKEPQFFSRGGILLECCHGLVPHVMPLFEADPTLLLDGELFAPLCNFEELNGLVRRLAKFTSPEMRQRQAQLLEYFSFDIMHSAQLSAPNAPFSERYQLLKKLIPICGAKRISAYQHDEQKRKIIRRKQHPDTTAAEGAVKLYHVPAAQVGAEEMEEVLEEACSQGFEGVMIRRPGFPYEHGKRSFGLLKYKTMHDAEYRIVDFLPGQGKFKGGLGAFICETKSGIRFNATPKTTYENRRALWSKRERLLGKYLTVQYQELSSQDVPRFPIAKAVRGASEEEFL